MKKTIKLLAVLFVLTFTNLNAQMKSDTTLSALNKRVNEIQLNLSRSHYQYVNGVKFLGVGVAANLIGLTLFSQKIIGAKPYATIAGVGSLIGLTGAGIMIHSHIYIGNAGVMIKF